MLPYPAYTSREEKIEMISSIKERLLSKYGEDILAIGVYGSIGQEKDGPYSDIEMHVITEDGIDIKGHEFIYGDFKIEIDTIQKNEMFKKAQQVGDSWPIKAGSFIHILTVYDPHHLFEEIKQLPFQVSSSAIKETMREFMIWEPYETIGKIRNNYQSKNFNYLPLAALDLAWQTAKLIGLANRQYYSTRARTFEESMKLKSKPSGYNELAQAIMAGRLDDKQHVYQLCENLWTGLNSWYDELGIDYIVKELPF
ncbi:KNTase domain-containing protein [Bacillus sp. V3-13]|uniref:kanamycin nucleotidyltransferase C-terminal domain-containing protein n=1 Tax=Bacillus sp. V3-13 TaxID=2053728 RepID=UPI000C76C52E|nr:kanamycin nucleotidyltransferase C-terminal domain-containing protein [Bacillus sp. V3-13]PLR79244.1 KNTase domain-containing protein [Bacillus sp. V3-13]